MVHGLYAFSDYDLYAGEFAQQHLEQLRQGYAPDPILEVVYAFRGEAGIEIQTAQAEPAEELWVSARYDLKDPEEDFLAYFMEETTYPDAFVVRVEAAPYAGIGIVCGEPTDLAPGDIAVTVRVGDGLIPPETCHLEVSETAYEGQTFYAYAFVMPRPDTFPEHGTAHVTIVQRLLHSDGALTKTVAVEY